VQQRSSEENREEDDKVLYPLMWTD